MSRARAGLLLALSLVGPIAAAPAAFAADAAPSAGQARPGQALLVLVDGASFAELMAVPTFRQLARAGGAALMTTHVTGPDRDRSTYLTIGAGTLVSEDASAERALMVRTLDAAGLESCTIGAGGPVTGADAILSLTLTPAGTGTPLCSRAPSLAPEPGTASPASSLRVLALTGSAAHDGQLVRDAVSALPTRPTLVVVASPRPSPAMDRAGDEVTPLVVAAGLPGSLFPANGELHALTSDSTRTDGLVANVDLAPTVLRFFGVAIPSEMDGSAAVRTDAPAPFSLYDRELEYRRTRFLVQIGEVAFVSAAGLVAIITLLILRRRGRPLGARTSGPLEFLALCGAALPVAVLSGGLLPHLTYAWVVPYLVVASVALAALALRPGWPGPAAPLRFVGAVGVAFIGLDLALGGQGLRLSLLGGTMFDGVRFYGMPNAAISPLLASALFVSAGLTGGQGFVVLGASGLLAGFPSLGANIGASITLFAAAGLWLAAASPAGRFRLRQASVVAGVMLGGLVVVLLSSRYLASTPTHATRLVERTGGRVGELIATSIHRLGIGAHQVLASPAALIPLVGLPIVLVLVLVRPGPLRRGLCDPTWRKVLAVLVIAAAVGYVANDTGVAAAAPAFLYAMVGLWYPTLRAWR